MQAVGGRVEEEDDPDWLAYAALLEREGYFGGHAPESEQYSVLSERAGQRYTRIQAYRLRAAALRAPATLVHRLLQASYRCWASAVLAVADAFCQGTTVSYPPARHTEYGPLGQHMHAPVALLLSLS